MSSLINSEHLCGMIGECISELKKGESSRLRNLASLLRSLAFATKNEVFMSTFPTLGSFGSSLTDYQKMILLAPMLTSEEKGKYRGTFETVCKMGVEALEKIKNEVSKVDGLDYKEVVVANAMLTEGWTTLAEKLAPFRMSRASS